VSNTSQDSASTSTQVRGTNAQAKTITITATAGDLTATAAKLQGDDISLEAAQNVQLQALANTSTISNRNDSSNTGAGVNIGLGQQNGISFQVSASQANGRANGSESTYDNTRISANKTLSVKSGADTTLAGAQLAGDSVKMDVGGKLNIETLQSSSTYQSEQHSTGFNMSLCVPPICYGVPVTVSVSQSQQTFNHNYQSAVGQSGIAAGSGGFDIKVAGNTDLKGAAITSSATPDKNTLTTASLTSTDLDNRQDTHSASFSLNLGYSGASTLATLAQNAVSNTLGNLGGTAGLPENGSQSGKTGSVISAGHIVITGTGNKDTDAASQQQVSSLTSRDAKSANQTLSNSLTLQQAQAVQEQQRTAQENAQAGQLVGSVAFNVVGDIAQKNGWSDSSPQKMALHTIAGYIQARAGGQNGASGAVAALGNEAMTKVVNDTIEQALPMPPNATAEQQREVMQSRKALAESAASVLGASAVALSGGSKQDIALGGTVALTADRFNRQLHPKEIDWIKAKAGEFAKKLGKDLGREVSTQEAMVWLTAAGESDVDANAQRSNGMFVRGTSNTEGAQAYDAAKAFIATGTKTNSGFIDANGQSQTLFTAKNGDFYKSQVYSEYRNDPQYRDYYWNVMGLNLKGDNMSPQEKVVYEQRQVIADKEAAKQLLTLGVQSVAGRVAVRTAALPSLIAQERAKNEGVYQRIVDIPKGQKPDPSTYLSAQYIDAHLSDFRDSGVVRFTSENSLLARGTAGPDGGFVFPKNKFDSLFAQSGVDLSIVEKQLGLPSGYLKSADTVAVYIKPADLKGLRMPSGNEGGALPSQWIPGGYTRGGTPEAVMDFSHKPPITILFGGKQK